MYPVKFCAPYPARGQKKEYQMLNKLFLHMCSHQWITTIGIILSVMCDK